MQVIYGHKWLSIIDSDELLSLAVEEWSERLAGLTGEQIKQGIANLTGEWPPTSIEFRSICVGSLLHNKAAYRPFEGALLEHKCDRAKARAELNKSSKILRGKS